MAEAFCRELGREVDCASAGTHPARTVMPETVAVMREAGIDISSARPKGFDALPAGKWDYLVTMGCGVDCPFLPGTRVINWEIPDPHGKGVEEYRRVRDIIRRKVHGLLGSLGLLKYLKYRPADNRQSLA